MPAMRRIGHAACEAALSEYPGEPRLSYLHARAIGHAAELAMKNKRSNVAALESAYIKGLEKAIVGGYPIAFNNMASAYLNGRFGVTKNRAKAAEFSMRFTNRVFACCWVRVARHLLAHAKKLGETRTLFVVHGFTRWAKALGTQGANELLEELYANGKSKRPSGAVPRASFSDIPPWFANAKID